VSAQHAVLVARPDGGWDVVDLGSTNGTSVGDTTDVITPNTPVAVAAGVPIRLGAWTVITLEQA
jgi:pSer/pThr/pTyr-binding forkhead associated (FHA) protein